MQWVGIGVGLLWLKFGRWGEGWHEMLLDMMKDHRDD